MKQIFCLILGLLMVASVVAALPQETILLHHVVVRNEYTGTSYVPSHDDTSNVYVVVHNNEKTRLVTDKRGNPVKQGCSYVYKEPKDMKHVSVTVVIQELGLRFKSSSLRIEPDKEERFNVPMVLPGDIEPGEYWARITVSNDDYRRVRYRPIVVE